MQQEGDSLIVPWKKSTASATSDCVEFALAADAVFLRNSRARDDGMLTFTYSEWKAFLAGVRRGEFEVE